MTALDEPAAQVTASMLRHAMGHFATGVTVVTWMAADGKPVGTATSAVSSLSLDPPLLLVCFDRSPPCGMECSYMSTLSVGQHMLVYCQCWLAAVRPRWRE